jgi:hypothetical protein
MAASIDHNATDICAIADRWDEFTISPHPTGESTSIPFVMMSVM